MVEHMREPLVNGAALTRKVMRFFVRHFGGEYMVKDFGADFPQQIILRVEVRVKGASADVRAVNDVLHGNAGIALCFEQRSKRLKYGDPRFSLAPVQTNQLPRIFLLNCTAAWNSIKVTIERAKHARFPLRWFQRT